MSKIKGRNLLVFLKVNGAYKAICAATTCELDENCDVQEVSSPTQGQWRNYVKKRKGWKVTTHHILDTGNVDNFDSLLGETVDLCFATTSDSNEAREASTRIPTETYNRKGAAICTRSTVAAKNGDWVNGTFEFIGNGELS